MLHIIYGMTERVIERLVLDFDGDHPAVCPNGPLFQSIHHP